MPTVTPAGPLFTVDETVDAMGFADDLKAAKTAADRHIDVEVPVNETNYTLRFRKVPSQVWVEAVDRSPARGEGFPYDMLYGYNLRSVTRLVAPACGVLVVDGQEVPLKVVVADPSDDSVVPANEWEDLFEAISGRAEAKIGDAVYSLNEHESIAELNRALAALKKAQGGSRKKSR